MHIGINSVTSATMLFISLIITIFFSLSFPSVLVSYTMERLPLPSTTTGPEAIAFDPAGAGPYTGVSDGRILKYINRSVGFVDFAITSPNRPKELCDGSSDPAREPTCGRPLGLAFNNQTAVLYIADAYFGLVLVGLSGGSATPLATSAEGVPFRFLNALDIDQQTGVVYFTDASARFQRNQFIQALTARDSTGRLVKYDPGSKEVTVLQRNLGLPVGVAVSRDGQYLVYTEALYRRAQRFWLTGSKANTSEIFARFQGQPDNIKRNSKGEFWVPINAAVACFCKRLRENGSISRTLILSAVNPVQQYSEVQEYQGKLYLGSVMLINYVGVISGAVYN